MSGIHALLRDRRSRQRGSVLGGLLIMIALLSIIIGALMGELSSSFVLSRTLVARVQREATVSSAAELGLYQLKNTTVPPVCVRDTSRGPWYISSLNGSPAAVTEACTAIVPEQTSGLAAGSFVIDGVEAVAGGHDSYIAANRAGRLRSYTFATAALEWTIDTGGAVTAPVLATLDPANAPAVELLVPSASPDASCRSHCIQLYEESPAGTPSLTCDMAAGAAVGAQASVEVSAAGSPNFPRYAFFGDSGGHLYVYDASTEGTCTQEAAQGGLGGAVVGQPLVYTGVTSRRGQNSSATADIVLVVSTATTTQLEHWEYVEATAKDGDVTKTLTEVSSVNLPVGGNAVVSGPSSTLPTAGSTIRVAVAGGAGRLSIGRVTVTSSKSGPTYAISAGGNGTVTGNVVAAPYWCRCPGGDEIGIGTTGGFLYLLDANLNMTHQYDGQADGRPAIRTTPDADANGDWYFGADDGFVYDVEIPSTGLQMFKAARFGPGGAIRSSPIAGACGTGPCLYFGSSTAGAYFVRLGSTRVMDLRACVTANPGTLTCASDPRLWVRAEIGPAVGGRGISVQGWSYYSP